MRWFSAYQDTSGLKNAYLRCRQTVARCRAMHIPPAVREHAQSILWLAQKNPGDIKRDNRGRLNEQILPFSLRRHYSTTNAVQPFNKYRQNLLTPDRFAGNACTQLALSTHRWCNPIRAHDSLTNGICNALVFGVSRYKRSKKCLS